MNNNEGVTSSGQSSNTVPLDQFMAANNLNVNNIPHSMNGGENGSPHQKGKGKNNNRQRHNGHQNNTDNNQQNSRQQNNKQKNNRQQNDRPQNNRRQNDNSRHQNDSNQQRDSTDHQNNNKRQHSRQQNKRNNSNSNNNNKIPEMHFEEYMDKEACLKGIETSELITGSIRVNVKRFQDAYINGDEKGARDIHIEGVELRNRALPGDTVVVKLLPEDQWKKAEDAEEDDASHFAKTGKVVYILDKKHSRVAAGFLKPFRNHQFGFALLSPVDSRLPRLMIPLDECPSEIKTRPKDIEKTLFVAKIIDWDINSAFAAGQIVRTLGEAGLIEPETEAILMQNEIDSSDFSEEVIQCLPNGDTWRVTEEELAKRKDLRNECIFTIDPATARDLDDALSCKRIGDDLFEVGVHIADVSHFIAESNALDDVARSRATSVYLGQKVIPMLPRILCEQLCSLNPGVERLAYSVIWNLKSDGTIVREWFGRSVIRSCVKLSYDHAQQMIETPANDLVQEDYPSITGNFPLSKIGSIVKDLYGLSVHLRTGRFKSGALRIDQPKISFTLDAETGAPSGCRVYDYKDSNKLIEEFMLLANMAVGRKILKECPKSAILRNHPPPNDMMMSDLENLCHAFDIPFDMTDSASINSSLQQAMSSDAEAKEYISSALTLMCAKPFENAKYFCTGSIDDQALYHHYALNVPIYTHFTSPIRRYPDVLVHRCLTASLDKSFKINDDVKDLQAIADHCNDKKWAAKDASEQSTMLFFAVFVRECGPLTERGVVTNVLDKALDVLALRLGVVVRVYCDQLALLKHEHKPDRVKARLVLYWQNCAKNDEGSLDDRLASLTKQFEQRWQHKKDGKDSASCSTDSDKKDSEDVEGAIKQELHIFSPVNIILSVKPEAPTKIVATLVNPHGVEQHPEHGL